MSRSYLIALTKVSDGGVVHINLATVSAMHEVDNITHIHTNEDIFAVKESCEYIRNRLDEVLNGIFVQRLAEIEKNPDFLHIMKDVWVRSYKFPENQYKYRFDAYKSEIYRQIRKQRAEDIEKLEEEQERIEAQERREAHEREVQKIIDATKDYFNRDSLYRGYNIYKDYIYSPYPYEDPNQHEVHLRGAHRYITDRVFQDTPKPTEPPSTEKKDEDKKDDK